MLTTILIASVLGQPGNPGSDDRGALRALAAFYKENRSKFAGGRIWFEFTDAFATNADEAAKGVVSDAHKAEGFYAFRGNDALYIRMFSDASMVATSTKIADGQVSHRLRSVRALTDGKVTLQDDLYGNPEGGVTRGTIITPGAEVFYKAAAVPLGLGAPDITRDDLWRTAQLIQGGASGLSLGRIEDEATSNGVKTVRIEVNGPGGKRVMWVDPERGAIPRRVHDEMPGGGTYDLQHGDLRMVAGRGWLPYERTEFLPGGRVLRTVVTKVDFGKVPDDTFRLEFPEPVAMVNLAKGLSYRPRKVWELSRLPSANSPRSAPLMTPPGGSEPVMPGERESPTPLFTSLALGLSAVVAIVGCLRWRRPHQASR